jgi:hypothetical protein
LRSRFDDYLLVCVLFVFLCNVFCVLVRSFLLSSARPLFILIQDLKQADVPLGRGSVLNHMHVQTHAHTKTIEGTHCLLQYFCARFVRFRMLPWPIFVVSRINSSLSPCQWHSTWSFPQIRRRLFRKGTGECEKGGLNCSQFGIVRGGFFQPVIAFSVGKGLRQCPPALLSSLIPPRLASPIDLIVPRLLPFPPPPPSLSHTTHACAGSAILRRIPGIYLLWPVLAWSSVQVFACARRTDK